MSSGAAKAARTARSRAEWVSFAMASAILLTVAGTIGALWIQESHPPQITVTLVGAPRGDGGSVYVTAEVQNQGTETAQDVQIVAELVEDGEAVQTGEQGIRFLAGGASEQLVFVLDTRADLDHLTLRVESYTIP